MEYLYRLLIVNENYFHIYSNELKELEVTELDSSTISAGKYHFLKETFNWANKKLIESFNIKPEWLVIDEGGKLELNNDGQHSAINKILNSKTEMKIILVIHKCLVE